MGCGGCGRNAEDVNIGLTPEPGQPLLDPDGTIRYAERAPDIIGYERDPDDETITRPVIKAPCSFRTSGILLNKDGNHTMNHVCGKSGCPLRWQKITLEDCQKCDHREV